MADPEPLARHARTLQGSLAALRSLAQALPVQARAAALRHADDALGAALALLEGAADCLAEAEALLVPPAPLAPCRTMCCHSPVLRREPPGGSPMAAKTKPATTGKPAPKATTGNGKARAAPKKAGKAKA